MQFTLYNIKKSLFIFNIYVQIHVFFTLFLNVIIVIKTKNKVRYKAVRVRESPPPIPQLFQAPVWGFIEWFWSKERVQILRQLSFFINTNIMENKKENKCLHEGKL